MLVSSAIHPPIPVKMKGLKVGGETPEAIRQRYSIVIREYDLELNS